MFDVPQLLLGHFYSNIPTVKQTGRDRHADSFRAKVVQPTGVSL